MQSLSLELIIALSTSKCGAGKSPSCAAQKGRACSKCWSKLRSAACLCLPRRESQGPAVSAGTAGDSRRARDPCGAGGGCAAFLVVPGRLIFVAVGMVCHSTMTCGFSAVASLVASSTFPASSQETERGRYSWSIAGVRE